MTDWIGALPIGQGKRYRLLADGLAEAILGGRIEPGSQLPTQREMAHRLGISVTTVTRAYSELQEQGLIENKVGSGSFVRAQPGGDAARAEKHKRGPSTPLEALEGSLRHTHGLMDLSFNEPLLGPAARCVQKGLTDILTVDKPNACN